MKAVIQPLQDRLNAVEAGKRAAAAPTVDPLVQALGQLIAGTNQGQTSERQTDPSLSAR